METSAGQRILIDGGPSASLLLNHLGRVLPFWDRSIDLVVLTHPQRDHITGLLAVLRRYRVGAVLESGLRATTSEYAEWERLLQEKDIQRINTTAGTKLYLKDTTVEVLHPTLQDLRTFARTPNETSLVLHISAHGASSLLTGDIETDAERRLLRSRGGIASNVLKVPHHGSNTSSTQSFLDAVAPQVAIISVGDANTSATRRPKY